ncbi:MAG: hypothetical protein WC225_03080 [Acholeplasmataceae bacterium]|nr:DUF5011 domain-containing protein [Acholeplasmataceae bacterium]
MSFLFFLFGLSFWTSNVKEVTKEVVWENTVVNVPLGSDIYDYVETPQARLFIDGNEIKSTTPKYIRNGVNRTFISVISTSHVRNYHVYFKVIFEEYQFEHIVQITFQVVDITPPFFTYIPTFTIDVGAKLPNFETDVLYEDNYDEIKKLKLSVDSSQVNPQVVGNYFVIYELMDSSFNITKKYHPVVVVDRTPPTITLKNPLILEVHESFDFNRYFTITDNYDNLISPEVDLSQLNHRVVGSYPITITATDRSSNQTKKTYYLLVQDTKAPQLILQSSPEPIEVHALLSRQDLEKYIILLKDNYDELSLEQVHIWHDINTARLGKYQMTFSISDHSGNQTSQSMTVEVVDRTKPDVTIQTPLVFEVGQEPLQLSHYFIFKDNFTSSEDLKITYKHNCKFNQIGLFLLTVEVQDLQKNTTIFETTLTVVDSIPPEIEQLIDIIIIDFEPPEFKAYFRIFDAYDEHDIQIIFDDSKIDYQKIGIYELPVRATDKSGNKSFYFAEILVVDIEPPLIDLKTSIETFNINDSEPDLLSYISSVSDNYDVLTVLDVTIETNLDMNQPGFYEVTYTIFDQSGNKNIETLHILIQNLTPPVVTGSSLKIQRFETIDLLKDLHVETEAETFSIYYSPQIIDTSASGVYEITYVVIDVFGNETTFSRFLFIETPPNLFQFSDFIPILSVTIIAGILIFIVIKKS